MIPFLGFSEPFSSISHLLAAIASFVGGVRMYLRGRGSIMRLTSLHIYTFSLIFLFSMSGVYHLLEPGGAPRMVLQRLDHAAIWVLIAGTFTPIHTILFRGPWRWGILLLVWTLAITGLVLEVVFFDYFPLWLSLSLFLGLGWLGTFTGIKFRILFRDRSLALLIGGGVFYSIGALIDHFKYPQFIEGVVGPHEVFHVFVMLGALCHWWFVYIWSGHPVFNTIVFQVQIFHKNNYVAQARGEHLKFKANSLEELKVLIREGVAKKYHASIQPTVHLKYSQEEVL